MRTTLRIDDDVAAMLEQLRKKRGAALERFINEALRWGLLEMAGPKPRSPIRTRSVDLGRVQIASIDNIGEVLAKGEASA